MTRAIVFVKTKIENYKNHAARCVEHSQAEGYDLQGVVADDWDAVKKMLGDGQTSVVLVATEEHLDPKRKPRIEVVANQPSRAGASGKRSQMIRRRFTRRV